MTLPAFSSSDPWLYLASQSPRRRQLLDQLGVRHELLLPDPDEDAESLEAERPGESPEDYVQRVTLAKWQAAVARRARRAASGTWPEAPILCADTTVALGSEILGKPQDATHAAQMLSKLSGQSHKVLTAVVVNGHLRLSVSHVRWRVLDDDEISRYVASGEPMGKAGAYAIQGRSGAWTQHMDGSYSGIMGLPLFDTAELLKPLGWHF
ncbi:MAG: septum formation inhibitor Maf [Aquabacterium sp.]|uniref:Maf family protein n=1 Tax=Aquabacterium sp. TaxID=1872578 RepID=UPI00121259F0|nr:Maf family protein [Aquabacterium sp.]TAK99157.1 MAG: septum formation inhibitor Maf [Aquabacterium sp.]